MSLIAKIQDRAINGFPGIHSRDPQQKNIHFGAASLIRLYMSFVSEHLAIAPVAACVKNVCPFYTLKCLVSSLTCIMSVLLGHREPDMKSALSSRFLVLRSVLAI